MRIFFLIVSLFLAACGSENANNSSASTDVTISIGQVTALGAIGAPGSVPAKVQSISVTAINSSNQIIAGPVVANRPNLVALLRVPNGNNIRFRILAFNAANAAGIKTYETVSAPVDLKGTPVEVPVTMSLSVAVTASAKSTFRGGSINLTGSVAGNTPPASSPLLWSKTGGTFGTIDIYGAATTWTAPATVGKYSITAKIDPLKNPDQNSSVFGAVDIDVVNRNPILNLSSSAISVSEQSTNTTVLAVASDPDGDTLSYSLATNAPVWASIAATSGIITLAPPAASLGTYTIAVVATDALGATATKNLVVTVIFLDTTPPVITLIGANPFTIAQGATYVDPGSSVSDNVDTGLIATVVNTVNTAAIGTYTVTYTVSDLAGNAAIPVVRTVQVTDQTAPTITLLGSNPYTVAQGVTYVDPGSFVNDNVDTGLIATTVSTVNTAIVGTYTITYNVSDIAGNAAIPVVRTVQVTDQTAPVITLLGANPLTVAQGSTFVDPGSFVTDNIFTDLPLGATAVSTVNTAIVGTYTVTYNASDLAGNAAIPVVRTVFVTDQTAPVITLLGANPYTITQGATYIDPGSSVSDNVDTGLIATVSNLVNTAIAGSYTVTYNVSDLAGNAATPVVRTVQVNATAILNATSDFPGGMVVGGAAKIGAVLTDAYATPIPSALVRFTVQTSPYANFTQNGLQVLDVYTDVNGFATANVTDTYAGTVPILVDAVSYPAVNQTVNQLFATNTGLGTLVSIGNGNNAPCNTTWGLNGSPYLIQNNVLINNGCSLQIDPYVIVKVMPSTALAATGTGVINVYGQLGAEAYITSYRDDSVGGDTNGDGVSLGAMGDFNSFSFANANINHLVVRYGNTTLNGGGIIAINNISINDASVGLTMNGNIGSPSIANLKISNMGAYGISMATAGSLQTIAPIFTNVDIYSATGVNAINMVNTGGASNVVAPVFNGLNNITATGMSGPAIFISGISNNPLFNNFNIIGGSSSVAVNASNGTFSNSTFKAPLYESVILSNGASPSINSSNTIQNTSVPYSLQGQAPLPIDVYATLGAGITDPYSVHVQGIFSLPAPQKLIADPLGIGNSIWRVVGTLNIQLGGSLSVDPYAVIKLNPTTGINVNKAGVFNVYGQPTAPVYFTSIHDDIYGAALSGSTGAPAAGDWNQIRFNGGSSGSLANTHIRYAGQSLFSALSINTANPNLGASPILTNLTISDSLWVGLEYNANTNGSTVGGNVSNLKIINPGGHGLIVSSSNANTGNFSTPIITGTSISGVTGTFSGILVDGLGASPQISNMSISGGQHNILAQNGAGGIFTFNQLTGATASSIHLVGSPFGSANPSINSSNIINGAPTTAVSVSGQTLPAGFSPSLTPLVADPYSIGISGTFNDAYSALTPNPFGLGSQWLQSGAITIPSGSVMDIYAGTVFKANASAFNVSNGGTLNILGVPQNPVVFTSINDNTYGLPAATSTGSPIRGQGINLSYFAGSSGQINGLVDRYSTQMNISSSIPMSDVSIHDSNLGLKFNSGLTTPLNQIVSNLHINHWGAGGGSGLVINGTTGTNNITFAGKNNLIKHTAIHEAIQVTGAGANPILQNFIVDMQGFLKPAILVTTGAGGTYTNNILRNASVGIQVGDTLASWAAGLVNISNNAIVNNSIGILVRNAPNGSLITHNLIRGSLSNGILIDMISGLTPSKSLLQNNLIVENQTDSINRGAVRIKGDNINLVGPIVDLYSNTIADNVSAGFTPAGLVVDAYATTNMFDNIFALNTDAQGINIDTNIAVQAFSANKAYNLTTDGSINDGITDVFTANPAFIANWYLNAGAALSPAINADALRTQAGVGYLVNHAYTNIALPDTGNLDLGYHHANIAPIISDPYSTVTQTPLVAGPNGSTQITITPRDANNLIIGAGLKVLANFQITPIGTLGKLTDHGDGVYSVILAHSPFTGSSDTVGITVNATPLTPPVIVSW